MSKDRLPGSGGDVNAEAAAVNKAAKTAKYTDAVLALRVSKDYRDRFCWCGPLGWLEYDGRRWIEVTEVRVTDQVKHWVFGKLRDAVDNEDEPAVGAYKAALSKARLGAVVSLLRGDVEREAGDFDTHKDLLNVQNGVVDLRTGQLLDSDPKYLFTKVTRVAYLPDATHPDWTATLDAVPEDVRGWLMLRYGQGITGHMTPDDKFLVQTGKGDNGKTTVMVGIEGALGDYFVSITHRALVEDQSQHPTVLMPFRGARFAAIEETPEERRLSVVRLKEVVGTPKMSAHYMRKDEVVWDATHSAFLNTNYRPVVEETDHGTWRRLARLHFPYTYVIIDPSRPVEEQLGPYDRLGDPNLRDRMKAGEDGQHEAVLASLVRGAVEWYRRDKVMPPMPERVRRDTDEWRRESDILWAYGDERLVIEDGWHVASSDFLHDFNGWLKERKHREWSDRLLYARLFNHDHFSTLVKRYVTLGREGRYGTRSMPYTPSVTDPPPTEPKTGYQAIIGVRFATPEDR